MKFLTLLILSINFVLAAALGEKPREAIGRQLDAFLVDINSLETVDGSNYARLLDQRLSHALQRNPSALLDAIESGMQTQRDSRNAVRLAHLWKHIDISDTVKATSAMELFNSSDAQSALLGQELARHLEGKYPTPMRFYESVFGESLKTDPPQRVCARLYNLDYFGATRYFADQEFLPLVERLEALRNDAKYFTDYSEGKQAIEKLVGLLEENLMKDIPWSVYLAASILRDTGYGKHAEELPDRIHTFDAVASAILLGEHSDISQLKQFSGDRTLGGDSVRRTSDLAKAAAESANSPHSLSLERASSRMQDRGMPQNILLLAFALVLVVLVVVIWKLKK